MPVTAQRLFYHCRTQVRRRRLLRSLSLCAFVEFANIGLRCTDVFGIFVDQLLVSRSFFRIDAFGTVYVCLLDKEERNKLCVSVGSADGLVIALQSVEIGRASCRERVCL